MTAIDEGSLMFQTENSKWIDVFSNWWIFQQEMLNLKDMKLKLSHKY